MVVGRQRVNSRVSLELPNSNKPQHIFNVNSRFLKIYSINIYVSRYVYFDVLTVIQTVVQWFYHVPLRGPVSAELV